MSPAAAIAHVALFPREKRHFADITSSLAALNDLPDFAPAISFVDVGGDFVSLASALKRTFAEVFLANTHDTLTAIVFVHVVTSVAALGNMLPHLSHATGREALRYGWQAGAALYAAWGSQPRPLNEIASPTEDADTLIDMAIAHGDEHAIKFTEAALAQYAVDSSNCYLAAVRRAFDLLPRA
jgi:hypothetical protein